MTKLLELNKELWTHDLQRTKIVAKIKEEHELNKIKNIEPYQHLIGKYYKLNNDENNCYKILSISEIESETRILTNNLICETNTIYTYKEYHKIENVTEITQQQFEANLIQACNNME